MALRFQSKTCAKLDAERVDDVYRFDGIGGELAHADKNFIELDAEERWSIDLVEGKAQPCQARAELTTGQQAVA